MRIDVPANDGLADVVSLAMSRRDIARSPERRIKTAVLLAKRREFDDALSELAGIAVSERSFDAVLAEVRVLAKRNKEGDPERVRAHTLEWPGTTAEERSWMAAEHGHALKRLGKTDAARHALIEAFELSPRYSSALRHLTSIDVREGRVDALLSQCMALIDQRIISTGIIHSTAVLLAAAGRIQEARAMMGFDQFLQETKLEVPDGYSSLTDFNAALCAEIRGSPDLYYSGDRKPGLNMWRVENLRLRGMRALPTLMNAIRKQVLAYVHALPLSDHPFVLSRPKAAKLDSWSGITRAEGFEEWHLHPAGWLSGVYYAAVPESVCLGRNGEGNIRFGMSDQLLGKTVSDQMAGQAIIPRAGKLVLFPSSAEHATTPHGDAENDRIAISFDIIPQQA